MDRITQIIPLPDNALLTSDGKPSTFTHNTYDKNGNMTAWWIVGAALMSSGRVLPLIWDGYKLFDVIDEEEQ